MNAMRMALLGALATAAVSCVDFKYTGTLCGGDAGTCPEGYACVVGKCQLADAGAGTGKDAGAGTGGGTGEDAGTSTCTNGCTRAQQVLACVPPLLQNGEACGKPGSPCASCPPATHYCAPGQGCVDVGTCDGCVANGLCQPIDNQDKARCGSGGQACRTCGLREDCSLGMCVTSCPSGCVDGSGVCQTGKQDSACGSGGAACVECLQGTTCDLNTFTCKTSPAASLKCVGPPTGVVPPTFTQNGSVTEYKLALPVRAFAVADLDGDHLDEVAVAHPNGVRLLRNNQGRLEHCGFWDLSSLGGAGRVSLRVQNGLATLHALTPQGRQVLSRTWTTSTGTLDTATNTIACGDPSQNRAVTAFAVDPGMGTLWCAEGASVYEYPVSGPHNLLLQGTSATSLLFLTAAMSGYLVLSGSNADLYYLHLGVPGPLTQVAGTIQGLVPRAANTAGAEVYGQGTSGPVFAELQTNKTVRSLTFQPLGGSIGSVLASAGTPGVEALAVTSAGQSLPAVTTALIGTMGVAGGAPAFQTSTTNQQSVHSWPMGHPAASGMAARIVPPNAPGFLWDAGVGQDLLLGFDDPTTSLIVVH